MVLVLRFELRLNLVRASGLLVIDCRFELHIPNKSIKAGALTIELDEYGEIILPKFYQKKNLKNNLYLFFDYLMEG